jgi:alpha-galactosidase
MTQASETSKQCGGAGDAFVAHRVNRELQLDAAHPASEWQQAQPALFCTDWQGKNSDAGRETSVRALWTPDTLYLRFECRYRELFLFADADPDGRRDHLWDRDVAEAFLQPEPWRGHFYKEFEVSPNGYWIDLDITPTEGINLKSGLRRSVMQDAKAKTWAAELAIPMSALTGKFDARAEWRVNFYRVEGPAEPRAYLAWRPTHTAEPNFHVPAAFGWMRFE